MSKTVYIGVALDTKQLVTGADVATATIKRFGATVTDASGQVKKSSVPALDAYTRATINAEKATRTTTSAIVPLKAAQAELTRTTKALESAMRAEVASEAAMVAQAKVIAEATRNQTAAQKLYNQSLKDSTPAVNTHALSLASLKTSLLGLGAGYLSVQALVGFGKSLIDVSDKYTMLEGRLSLYTTSAQNLASVEASLYQVAQRTRNGMIDTADTYTQLALATKQLGTSQGDLLKITEMLNKAVVVSGSGEAGQQAMRQLNQALASGVLQGDELKSLKENLPMLAQAIADGLQVPIGALKEMGAQGKLTSEVVIKALIDQSDAMNEKFGKMGTTVGQAMTEVKNAYESVINDANKATEGTASLAGSIESLARTIEQNKGGIISAFEGIANSIGWAIDRLAAFGNAYKLHQLYQTGKISFWDYATAGTDKAQQLIAKQGSAGSSIGDETGMQMALAAKAAAPAIREVSKAIQSHTAAAQNHTKAASSGASAASKAAAAAEKQAKETDRLREKYETIIARTSPVAKLQEEYADKLEIVAKAHKELNISLEKQAEDVALLAREHEKALKKPFEQIAKQFEKRTALDEYTSALSKIDENLADVAKGEKDRAVQLKAAEEASSAVVSAMQEELTQKGISVKVTKKNASEIDKAYTQHEKSVKAISDVLQSTGNAAGLSSGFISHMTEAIDELNKGAILGGKNLKGIASAIQAIGSQFGGRVGDALVGMGVGFKALLSGPVLNDDGTTNHAATDMSRIGGYAAIGQNIGALIGGNIGQKISSTVSGAVSGMSIGAKFGAASGPVGMAIGGILGGALGLFGGGDDSAKKAAKVTGIQEQEKAIANLAEGGSAAARYIMQLSNYDMGNVSEIDSRKLTNYLPSSITSDHYKSDYRLLGMDYEGKGSDAVEFLTALDGIDKAFKAISESSIVTELDDIAYKYEMIGAKIGDNADLWAAKLSEQMLLLTGFSVDSTSSVLDEIITSTDPSKVGDAFAEKMTEGLATSLRQMEISKFATTLAEQTLTPLYEEATRMMLDGGDSSTALAAVNDGLISVSQQVTDFANNLDELGISGYNAAGSTTALTTATTAADVATARLSYQISLLSGTEKDAAATAAEAWSIENELISLLGDTASARERELALLSPLNRALKEMVYAISDAQSAASNASSNLQSAQSKADAAQSALESAYNALNGQDSSAASNALADAKTAVSDALSALSDTINAQKDSLTEQYNAATELINSQLTATRTTLSAAESISSSAKSFLSAMTSETLLGRTNAQADLTGYLNDAQRGVLPDSKKFSDTLSVLSQDSQQYFSSSVDWARDYFSTANKVAKIGGIAETKQTDAQKAVTVAEEQLAVMKSSYENSIASLDAQYASAEAQVAALDRVNASVMSLSEALLAYKNAQAETGSSVTSAVNNASSAYEKALADNAAAQAELASAQQENTTAQATLTAAMNAAAQALAAQKAIDTTAGNAAISQQPVSIANTAANALYGSVFGGVTETQISAFTADAASTGIGSAVKDFWLNPSVLEKINSSSDPLEEAYRLVLGRASDQEGKSFWQSQMATGATISNVITDFLKSIEYSKIKNVRGYATGGISTGTFIAGDINGQGGEIIDVGSNSARIYNNADSKKMLDNSDVVSVINALREEVKSLRAEVAKGNGYAKETSDATTRMNQIGIRQRV